MNGSPLDGTFVTGTTGTGYRLVQRYSYTFKTDPPGDDMIAKIMIPYDPIRLRSNSIEPADTFIGKLADDKKAWTVSTARQTVQRSQFHTSMSQMTSLDGEYVILGRKGTDNGNIFLPYGTGAQFSAFFAGGPGRQDVEFMDGLRFAVQSEFPLRMNVDLKYPLNEKEVPEGMLSLNTYAWVVNTTGRVELTPPADPIPATPVNGTQLPLNGTLTVANGTTSSLDTPPNAPPAPVNSAKPFTFASSRRRQLPPAAAPQPITQPEPPASGSPDLPAGNTALTPAPTAPAPPAIPGAPPPPVPGSPPASAPPVNPPTSQGIVTAARIDFPVNMDVVRQMMRTNPGQGNADPVSDLSDPQLLSTMRFTIGRRPTGAEPETPFDVVPMAAGSGLTPNAGNTDAANDVQSLQLVNGRLVLEGVTQLDGEYIILVDSANTVNVLAAKAGLIKQSSGVENRGRIGAVMGAFAATIWLMGFL